MSSASHSHARHYGRGFPNVSFRASLESEVARRLSEVSDVDMQRLAYAYAKVLLPERFTWLSGRAINSEGQTIGGRADGFVIGRDGVSSIVEATRLSKKEKITRSHHTKGHFHEILAHRAAQGRSVDTFVYVAGHPDVQFLEEEINTLRDLAAAALGTRPGRIFIVGGDALQDAMCEPSLARARIELLGISDTRRFVMVRRESGPDPTRRFRPGTGSPFIPTAEDLDAGTIHFPALGPQVNDRLDTDRFCFVRGFGASGKSVLAWLIGLQYADRFEPSYVADLQTFADDVQGRTAECIEEIRRFADDRVLFIVDNCHLAEQAAWEIYEAWKSMVFRQPRLLMLGRETKSAHGSSIDGLDVKPLLLRAREKEVRGVFRRLRARTLRSIEAHERPPEPSSNIIRGWAATFGDPLEARDGTTDLIALSAAIQNKMPALLKGKWPLTETDAADEIRRTYLNNLTREEKENLYRVAAFQDLEIIVSTDLLPYPDAGFGNAQSRLGLVFPLPGPAGSDRVSYRLAHASLGRLILAAANRSNDVVAAYKAAAISISTALMTIGRLIDLGRQADALEVAEVAFSSASNIEALSLAGWTEVFGLLERLPSFDAQALNDAFSRPHLASRFSALVSAARFGTLAQVFSTIDKSSSLQLANTVSLLVVTPFKTPALAQELLEDGLSKSISWLRHFLAILRDSSLEAATQTYKSVLRYLCQDQARIRFVEAICTGDQQYATIAVDMLQSHPDLDQVFKEVVLKCGSSTAAISAILSELATSQIMEADVEYCIDRDLPRAEGKLRRIIEIFGESDSPDLRDALAEARKLLASLK